MNLKTILFVVVSYNQSSIKKYRLRILGLDKCSKRNYSRTVKTPGTRQESHPSQRTCAPRVFPRI